MIVTSTSVPLPSPDVVDRLLPAEHLAHAVLEEDPGRREVRRRRARGATRTATPRAQIEASAALRLALLALRLRRLPAAASRARSSCSRSCRQVSAVAPVERPAGPGLGGRDRERGRLDRTPGSGRRLAPVARHRRAGGAAGVSAGRKISSQLGSFEFVTGLRSGSTRAPRRRPPRARVEGVLQDDNSGHLVDHAAASRFVRRPEGVAARAAPRRSTAARRRGRTGTSTQPAIAAASSRASVVEGVSPPLSDSGSPTDDLHRAVLLDEQPETAPARPVVGAGDSLHRRRQR